MQSSSDGRWEGRGPFHVPSAARRRVAPPVASPHLPGSVAHVTTRLPACRSAQCCCGAVGVVRTRGEEDQVQPNLIHVPWRYD